MIKVIIEEENSIRRKCFCQISRLQASLNRVRLEYVAHGLTSGKLIIHH